MIAFIRGEFTPPMHKIAQTQVNFLHQHVVFFQSSMSANVDTVE
jgi:hypothetical protein